MTRKLFRILIPFLLTPCALADPPTHDASLFGITIQLQSPGVYRVGFSKETVVGRVDQMVLWSKILIDGVPVWSEEETVTKDGAFDYCSQDDCNTPLCGGRSCFYRSSTGRYYEYACKAQTGPCQCVPNIPPPWYCKSGLGGWCGCPLVPPAKLVPDIAGIPGATMTIQVGPLEGDANQTNNTFSVLLP